MRPPSRFALQVSGGKKGREDALSFIHFLFCPLYKSLSLTHTRTIFFLFFFFYSGNLQQILRAKELAEELVTEKRVEVSSFFPFLLSPFLLFLLLFSFIILSEKSFFFFVVSFSFSFLFLL